jgi:hypothetical protein
MMKSCSRMIAGLALLLVSGTAGAAVEGNLQGALRWTADDGTDRMLDCRLYAAQNSKYLFLHDEDGCFLYSGWVGQVLEKRIDGLYTWGEKVGEMSDDTVNLKVSGSGLNFAFELRILADGTAEVLDEELDDTGYFDRLEGAMGVETRALQKRAPGTRQRHGLRSLQ